MDKRIEVYRTLLANLILMMGGTLPEKQDAPNPHQWVVAARDAILKLEDRVECEHNFYKDVLIALLDPMDLVIPTENELIASGQTGGPEDLIEWAMAIGQDWRKLHERYSELLAECEQLKARTVLIRAE